MLLLLIFLGFIAISAVVWLWLRWCVGALNSAVADDVEYRLNNKSGHDPYWYGRARGWHK